MDLFFGVVRRLEEKSTSYFYPSPDSEPELDGVFAETRNEIFEEILKRPPFDTPPFPNAVDSILVRARLHLAFLELATLDRDLEIETKKSQKAEFYETRLKEKLKWVENELEIAKSSQAVIKKFSPEMENEQGIPILMESTFMPYKERDSAKPKILEENRIEEEPWFSASDGNPADDEITVSNSIKTTPKVRRIPSILARGVIDDEEE
eukprot:GHVP01067038.1.p2 GENE.GHVP01067038.1~~GHVP01067038.1.p2  ORF type:complete len:244 (-),score=73.07 GHVP01067038.1:2123-2746(-)